LLEILSGIAPLLNPHGMIVLGKRQIREIRQGALGAMLLLLTDRFVMAY